MAIENGKINMIVDTKRRSSQVLRKQCPICDEIGVVEAVEIVPGGGILYRSTHENGKQCQWSKFPDMDAAQSAKWDQPQQEIRCPECNEWGIIVAEIDESDIMKQDNWKYSVSHPTTKCLITPENRNTILKALDRYIDKNEIIERKEEAKRKTRK